MDYDKLLNLGAELGRQLMTSGAEIYRVEESVTRLLTAYGLEPQVFAIPNCLFVSVTGEDGHPRTRMYRIPAHGTDIELLEQCNDLCRRLCREIPPVEEASRLVESVPARTKHHSRQVELAGYVITSAFFAMFFGGVFWDWLSAALCGLAVGSCMLYGQRLTGSNNFFRTMVGAAVISATALFLVTVGLGRDLEAITIGTLMVLVPGMALTNAMREIMAGDIFSGLHRTAEVILVATAIALGTAIPMVVTQYW